MDDECAINRYEPQVLDLALCQEESVEWITRLWLRIDRHDNMVRRDRQDSGSERIEMFGNVLDWNAPIQLSELRFDCYFPQAGNTKEAKR